MEYEMDCKAQNFNMGAYFQSSDPLHLLWWPLWFQRGESKLFKAEQRSAKKLVFRQLK